MLLKIFYKYGDEPESYFDFNGDTLTIGRSSLKSQTVDLNLYPDGSTSRRHAVLYFKGNSWWVTDAGSTHGTYYNDKPIKTSTMIPSGGVIVIGSTHLRLLYGDSAEDVTGSQNGIVYNTINPFDPVPKISESMRLEMLSRVASIGKYHSGQVGLEMLARSIQELFGKRADHVGVVVYEDKQPIPLAFLPPEKSYVSFSLVEKVMDERIAFIWDQSSTSGNQPNAPSLKKVVTAMYAPITYNHRIIGVLHVNSVSPNVRFTRDDLEIFTEIARSSSLLFHEQHNMLNQVPTVFISYSRKNKDFIKRLSNDLRRQVIGVWYDDRLRAGEEWELQLSQAIEVMNVCLLIMSPSSLSSKNVKWELDQARLMKKAILPVLYEACENIPDWLSKIQYVDFTRDYQRGLTDLIDEICHKSSL